MSLNLFQNIHPGSWAGLPDIGLTESIQKILFPQKAFASSGGSQLLGSNPQAQTTMAPKPTTTQTPVAPGAGTPSGLKPPTVTPPPTTQQPAFNPQEEANAIASREAAARAEAEGKVRSGIESSYEPIFAELDRQIGLLPGQRGEFEKMVEGLATSQTGQVGTRKEAGIAALEGAKTGEIEQGKTSLRELGGNIEGLLKASSQYLGARGAGDSSAVGAASEGIVRAGQQSAAKILAVRDQALAAIDQKVADVDSLATEQLGKIDNWKAGKLFDISTYFADRLNTLSGQKVQASGEKATALANLIQNTQSEFLTRLKQLDDAVFNYKSSVATWQQQRSADLEDFKTKMEIASQYQSTSPSQYKIITDAFGRTFAVNPANPSQVVPISGVLTPEQQKAQTKGGATGQPQSLSDFFNLNTRTPVQVPTIE